MHTTDDENDAVHEGGASRCLNSSSYDEGIAVQNHRAVVQYEQYDTDEGLMGGLLVRSQKGITSVARNPPARVAPFRGVGSAV